MRILAEHALLPEGRTCDVLATPGKDGPIEAGAPADLVSLEAGEQGVLPDEDARLDAWMFARTDVELADFGSAGRHAVRNGRHESRDEIARAYGAALRRVPSRP